MLSDIEILKQYAQRRNHLEPKELKRNTSLYKKVVYNYYGG